MIKRCYLNEVPVDLGPRSEVWERVREWLLSGQKPRQVITLNAIMLTSAFKDNRLQQIIRKADLVIVDSYGIKMALKRRGFLTEQFPGIELAEQLLDFCLQERLTVYCFGGTKGAVHKLREKFSLCGAVYFRDGFSENEALVREEILRLAPQLLLVGLGSPRQEYFLADLLPHLPMTVGIGIGGGLEVISGQKARAPKFIIKHGGEWCYRLLQDPKKIKLLPELVKFWYYFLR